MEKYNAEAISKDEIFALKSDAEFCWLCLKPQRFAWPDLSGPLLPLQHFTQLYSHHGRPICLHYQGHQICIRRHQLKVSASRRIFLEIYFLLSHF